MSNNCTLVMRLNDTRLAFFDFASPFTKSPFPDESDLVLGSRGFFDGSKFTVAKNLLAKSSVSLKALASIVFVASGRFNVVDFVVIFSIVLRK